LSKTKLFYKKYNNLKTYLLEEKYINKDSFMI